MKNLILSALLVLTVSFAFAANDVKKVSTFDVEKTVELNNAVDFTAFNLTSENYSITKTVGTCYVTIGFYDSNGNKVAERTLQFNNVDSEAECSDLADAVGEALENL